MAIINNNHRFIFVHIPKNAGTSVSNYYCEISTPADVEIGGSALGESMLPGYINRYQVNKHTPARSFRKKLGEELFGSYFKFCLVRDPYARVKSTYYFLKNWLPTSGVKRHASAFEKFNSPSELVESEYWMSPGIDNIFRPQSFWTHSDTGEQLVDYIGRVETASESVAEINKALGLEMPAFDVRSNVSDRSKDTGDLTREAVQRIQDRYVDDFKLFGYERKYFT